MILNAENLQKKYQQGETTVVALAGVDLQLQPGETVAIVGASGSGKTTLLSLIAGLDLPSEGSVSINKKNLSQLSPPELAAVRAKDIGIIFQQFHLTPHLTALENVCLPLEILKDPNPIDKAKAALDSVGLGHRQHHLPSQLSGGESQRVAMARALVKEPMLILADEPSGSLDYQTGVKVMDLLFDLVEKRKSTLLLVTHDSELAKRCQRQMHLQQGRFL
ncbi:MAG: ABC transporter ATP-binding protein [Bdellovibrionales bacterium]|nr:ABC transporter ATP-binding protein [Bdellovibrionales bacterium]